MKREKGQDYRSFIIILLWLFAASSLEFFSLQTGLLIFDVPITILSIPRFLLNLFLILFIHFFLRLLFGRWSVSFYLSSVFFFLWAIADYYTIRYHGSPLFFSELANVRAALALSGSYKLHFHWVPGLNLIIFITEMAVTYLLHPDVHDKRGRHSLRIALLSAASLFCFVSGFYLLHLLVNDYILGWKWYDNVQGYGFICCAAEDFRNTLFPFTSDDPFHDNPLLSLEEELKTADSPILSPEDDPGKKKTPLPDIILILNESFYDLAVQSDLKTDRNYLEDYYSIEQAVYGYAECPNIGGRTNDSEYELLTGCSMDRLRASAPFNYLDLTKGPSLARFLKSLGYETTAMHCGQPGIYSRDSGYRELGFDHIILGPDHFPHHNYNGRREWLDEDNYKDLISQYERQGNGPRFFYLLTYQNHGSYDQNDSSLDTVHPLGFDGRLKEEVGEYLSSVKLSARAIHRLTTYFSQQARPVVVCMIGDHAPPFIGQLPSVRQDKEEGLRQVPFMIWNNAGIDFTSDPLPLKADQAVSYRNRMGWKDKGKDMTEIMADLLRHFLLKPLGSWYKRQIGNQTGKRCFSIGSPDTSHYFL